MNADPAIAELMPRLCNLRHTLHQIPELGYQEFKTAAAIRAELDRLSIPHVDGVPHAPTATIAWIDSVSPTPGQSGTPRRPGSTSKPCIALRADIDALPILEATGLPYASTHAGTMHACGHDGHATTLLGAAAILKSLSASLPVCVKFLWQPAEETGGGAKRLVDAGVLDGRIGPKVSAVFGLHGWPGLPVGSVATKPGPLLATTDNFSARFIGKGCHAAFPHTGRDPIVAAAEATLNLQQFVSREIDPTESALITVAMFHAGTAYNIIPDTATIQGTARTLGGPIRKQIAQSMQRRCAGIAAACGCQLQFTWYEGYPATINDPAMADHVAKTARSLLGNDHFLPAARPVMGGEDFAYYLEKVPGCFFLVGVEPPGTSGYPSLHSDHYDFNDAAMETGMRMFVELVRRYSPANHL